MVTNTDELRRTMQEKGGATDLRRRIWAYLSAAEVAGAFLESSVDNLDDVEVAVETAVELEEARYCSGLKKPLTRGRRRSGEVEAVKENPKPLMCIYKMARRWNGKCEKEEAR